MASNQLVLIDGHSLAFRAYNALPADLRSARGELTNAIYGFTTMLLIVWRDVQPEYMAVAFDVGRTFRHDVYPEYKAQRGERPEDVGPQIERICQLVEAFRLPIFTVPGFEADDVLGTLARQAAEQGLDTLIVTGDLDALQLVDEHTRVLTSGRRFSDTVIYDVAAVQQRYGLTPAQLVDYKGLVGDPSDNIPGVRGIGEKTASELLRQYGSLENIYAHLPEIKNKRAREALAAQQHEAFLSRDLARIITNVPITLDLKQCRTGEYDRNKVLVLFRELNFNSLLNRLPPTVPRKEPKPAGQPALFKGVEIPRAAEVPEALVPRPLVGEYRAVTTSAELEALATEVRASGRFAFDVETAGEDPWVAQLVGLAIAPREGRGYYVPVSHLTGETQLPLPEITRVLRPLFEDAQIAKAAHNAKFDLAVLERIGVNVEGPLFDTMVAEWVLSPASYNLALKNLVWARLGIETQPISELIGTGKKAVSMATLPIERVMPYAAADADMTLRLVEPLERELKEKQGWNLFNQIEMPLIRVLMNMERVGVLLDAAYLAELSVDMQRRLADLEEKIQAMVGHPFNIGSTEQLSDALFISLGLPKQGLKKTKSGHYSTAADVLENLRGRHPVIDLILEHRQLQKLKSTYIDALPALINPQTGRLHTSFNQTGTVTGRLSSSEPNLQNIPIRTDIGRQVRRAFIAQPGWLLLDADYSQVELRILAHISRDPAMIEAFRRGEDIHARTAAAIFNVPIEQVDENMRRIAKTTNFAISYGVTGFGLSKSTGLSAEEASLFIVAYFEQFPGIRRYVEETKEKAMRDGYVETLLGRRRYFPELQAQKIAHNVRAAAERMAINAPIQGSAADIIKIAMIRLDQRLREAGLKSRMVLQVHDELILEVPAEELETVAPIVCETMEHAFPLVVPLKVDMQVGPNWLDMKGI